MYCLHLKFDTSISYFFQPQTSNLRNRPKYEKTEHRS